MCVNIQDIFKDIKPLGFGLMRLPVDDEDDLKTINIDKFTEMIDTFMDHGFNYFDTAYISTKAAAGIGTVIATVGQRNPSIRETFSKERQIAAGVPEVSI